MVEERPTDVIVDIRKETKVGVVEHDKGNSVFVIDFLYTVYYS